MNKIEHFHGTGKDRYFRIVRRSDGYIWNGSAFVASPAWADTAIAMTENTDVIGYYTGTVPSNIGTGRYFALIYEGLAGSAANTDTRVQIKDFAWDGIKIIFDVFEMAVALETTVLDADPDGSDVDRTFTLASGSSNDNEYNNMTISITDVSGGVTASRRITDYTGSSKKVTVDYAFEFPIADSDIVRIWADTYSSTAGAAAANEISDAVWGASKHNHATGGTMGALQQRKGEGMRTA